MIAGLSVTYEWLLLTYLVESTEFRRFIVRVQTYFFFFFNYIHHLKEYTFWIL